jgi:hypothetical protein
MLAQKKRRTAIAGVKSNVLEAIIGKAILDPTFRRTLFRNPEKVRKEFNLTAKEVTALKTIKQEHLEDFAEVLQTKLLKSASSTIFCAATRRE